MKRNATLGIVIHTTASNDFTTAEAIQNFFLRILRWGKGGYHTIYNRNGSRKVLYDWRFEATNGILPNGIYSNQNTIHLSYIGGIKNYKANEAVCNITAEQEKSMVEDIKSILKWYPNAKIIGHNQINQKYCPSFWVPDWAKSKGFDVKNIDERDVFGIESLIKNLPHPPLFYES